MSDWQVSDRQFGFQGLTLGYRDWKNSSALSGHFPVIALHGWMDNAGTFDALIPELTTERILALDFSGHGLSQHRSLDADYYIWIYVEEIRSLLAHEGIERCHLLAHSMGGAVACMFAALYPEQTASLVILDIAGPIPTEESDLPAQMRKAMQERSGIPSQPIRHYPSLSSAQYSRANRGIELTSAETLGKRGIQQDEAGWYWSVDRQLTRRHLVSFSEAQCEAFLRKIESPTLAITAAETWAHRKEFLERRLALISNLEHYQLQGNHFQHLEDNVAEVAALVNGFYQDQLSLSEENLIL